jgi:hypothetical protein
MLFVDLPKGRGAAKHMGFSSLLEYAAEIRIDVEGKIVSACYASGFDVVFAAAVDLPAVGLFAFVILNWLRREYGAVEILVELWGKFFAKGDWQPGDAAFEANLHEVCVANPTSNTRERFEALNSFLKFVHGYAIVVLAITSGGVEFVAKFA